MTSVLQAWVTDLPLRYQGVLLTGMRGCDVTPKLPLDAPERELVGFLRFCVMNPADPREVGCEPGSFFRDKPPADWKASELGHYPLHWFSHLMHCYEVVGYEHPHSGIADQAIEIYCKLVASLHLEVESRDALHERMTEDRIAKGSVVS